jgi:hypothetical protein
MVSLSLFIIEKRGDKKMILYYAGLTTTLPKAVLHRLAENPGEEAWLLTGENNFTPKGITTSRFNTIFSKVITFPIFLCFQFRKLETDQIVNNLVLGIDEIFNSHGVKIEDFSEIHVFNDSDGQFCIYLYEKKIKYRHYEGYKELFSTIREVNFKKYKETCPNYYEFFKRTDPYNGFAENAFPVLLPESVKSPEIHKEYDIWNPGELIEKLTDKELEIVFEAYDYTPELDNCDETCLVIMQSHTQSKKGNPRHIKESALWECLYGDIMDVDPKNERYYLMYSIPLDFYTKMSAPPTLKTHPHLTCDNYQELDIVFPTAKKIRVLPFDYLSLYMKRNKLQFGEILSFNSTSNTYLKGLAKEYYVLSDNYWSTWLYYYQTYFALRLYRERFSERSLYVTEEIKFQVTQMFEHIPELFTDELVINTITSKDKIPANAFVLLADWDSVLKGYTQKLKTTPKDTIVAIVNVKETYPYYSKEINLYVRPMRIHKEQLKKYTLESMRDENMILIAKYTPDARLIQSFECSKTLHYTGVKLSVTPLTYSQMADVKLSALSTIANVDSNS